jgi:hypothetical protein
MEMGGKCSDVVDPIHLAHDRGPWMTLVGIIKKGGKFPG